MRRRWFILGLAVLVAVVMVIGAVPRPQRPRVSREQFERIGKGMTREEVKAIIGGPPGEYNTGQVVVAPFSPTVVGGESWLGDGGLILVRFDETGRVRSMEFGEIMFFDKPGVIDRVRAWIGF